MAKQCSTILVCDITFCDNTITIDRDCYSQAYKKGWSIMYCDISLAADGEAVLCPNHTSRALSDGDGEEWPTT